MKLIVDSNIIFSACITPFSDNADILLNPKYNLEFYSCHYLFIELFKHQNKIITLAKQSKEDTLLVLYSLIKRITFINEELISQDKWRLAENLTRDVDSKDIAFLALNLQVDNSFLWTNDSKLTNGLKAKHFYKCIGTKQILELFLT